MHVYGIVTIKEITTLVAESSRTTVSLLWHPRQIQFCEHDGWKSVITTKMMKIFLPWIARMYMPMCKFHFLSVNVTRNVFLKIWCYDKLIINININCKTWWNCRQALYYVMEYLIKSASSSCISILCSLNKGVYSYYLRI